MFETLTPDASSASENPEGLAQADPSPLEASDPGLDNPDYEAPVANGVEDDSEEIPFHNHPRWKELMGQKRALEDELSSLSGFAPVVERLRGMGFESAEAFNAALAAEEQRQFEANLAQALNAGVRNGAIHPAAAQAQFDAALRQRQMNQADAQRQAYEIDQQVHAAKRDFPEMDDEMVRQVAQANSGRPGFDLASVARRSHERNLSYLERHLALYEAERAAQPPAPLSNDRGSHAANSGRAAARRSWEDLLGLTRLVKT